MSSSIGPVLGAAATGIAIRYRPIASLQPAAYNPRAMPEDEMTALVESIRAFGLVDPILARRGDLLVVGGHQRLEAAKRLGLSEVPVVELDLTDEQAKALNVALNKIHGEFDIPKLAELLASLPQDLQALTGFDEAEMRRVAREADEAIRAMQEVPGGLDDDVPVPEVAVTQLGDLWLLEGHRLLCADSTKSESYERLMAGDKAVLLATDPPYLVDYDGGNHPQSFSNRPEVRDKKWDSYKDPETGLAFFEGFLRAALACCRPGTPVYHWHAHRRQDLVDEAWKRVGLLRHQQIIWAKAHAVLTRSHYMWAHEPCLYGWLEGTPPELRPPPNETTIWSIDQVGQRDGIHPTQKPVEIFARPIRFHTVPGDIVLEPFSGSGSQIIAAEALGRRCFALELEPCYVDAAVQRWERVTGKKAVREGA